MVEHIVVSEPSITDWNPYLMKGEPVVLAEVARVLAWAGDVIDGVDRSRLGSFALDRITLVSTYAANFAVFNGVMASEISDGVDFIVSPDGLSRDEVKDVVSRLGANLLWDVPFNDLTFHTEDFAAEAQLWNCVVNNFDFGSIRRGGTISNRYVDRFRLLRRVYENPDKLSFFEAGIWDDDFIYRCIADGVDASLAHELM